MASPSRRWLTVAVPDDVPEARLQEGYAKAFRGLVGELLAAGSEVGVGYARGRGRLAFFAFSGHRRVG